MTPAMLIVMMVVYSIDPISQAIWLGASFLRPRPFGVVLGAGASSALMLALNGSAWAHPQFVLPYMLTGAVWVCLWSLLADRMGWWRLNALSE